MLVCSRLDSHLCFLKTPSAATTQAIPSGAEYNFDTAFVLAASPSMAADPAHVAQLKRTKKCVNCDLRGAKLSYVDLRGADLRDAKFCWTIMPKGRKKHDHC